MLGDFTYKKDFRLLSGMLCAMAMAATFLFSACVKPDPLPVQTVCGLEVDTNNIRETWVCDIEGVHITLKFLSEGELIYSSVNQNASLPYQLLFADSVIYGYYIGIDTTLRITKIYHDDMVENVNTPFAMHRIASDTIELEYIGFLAEPPFILDYYKFHIINQ